MSTIKTMPRTKKAYNDFICETLDGKDTLDFDDASGDYPSMDVAYMSDATHFNIFTKGMYNQVLKQFSTFYEGYCPGLFNQESKI